MANSNISTLTLHKDSRAVFKTKPKIRIIHVFAPEIIKTDVQNFRDLVQSLTGKTPPSKQKSSSHAIRKLRPVSKASTLVLDKNSGMQERVMIRKEEQEEEQGRWRGESDTWGGFLKDCAYLDGFDLQELQQFPDLLYKESSSPYNSSSASLSQNESF